MAKTSIKGAVRAATREDVKLRGAIPSDATAAATADSFVNFAHKLGIGADNPLTTSTYGFNPITRNRILLEWIHRGSWLGGQAIDVVADDMTRQGIEYVTEMPPEDSERLDQAITRLNVWGQINETIKWGRLYGGCLGVILIDGQDPATPLQIESVGRGAFRGMLVLDRWMVEPALEDLVTDMGPNLGLPKYYRIGANAPALRGKSVHFSRCVIRHVGVQLPYQQRLTENLWGLSVLERLYDRMVAFDLASTGAAQLVNKSYLRTLSIKGFREVVSMGGPALDGLVKYTDIMRRFQGMEGITLIDAEDKFEAQSHNAFSGLSDTINSMAEQVSGALQIPLTRLFGQSPKGFSDGDNDVRNYFDHIKQQQQAMHTGVVKLYRCAALSEEVALPPTFAIQFRSLWQLTATDKATIAKTNTETALSAREAGVISDQVTLQELRQSSRETGIWTNITSELIEAADAEVPDPMEGMVDPMTGLPIEQPPGMGPGGPGSPPGAPFGADEGSGQPKPPGAPGAPKLPGQEEDDGQAGQEAPPGAVRAGKARRVAVQRPPAAGRPPGPGDR